MTTEEEALAFIEEIRKKYWDARHHCYAYRIGDRNQLVRFSDDGEPAQTAGKPMLDVLEAVSYTHLDVYKRQLLSTEITPLPPRDKSGTIWSSFPE